MSCQEYRLFLEEFHTDEDILTIKVGPYRLTESEILGEVINWTLQYLSENKCPTKLSAPITRNVVETIQSESRKDPQLCGYDENEKTFDPTKLKNLVILALKTFCQRLLDNVELNKILPELSGKDYTPLCTTGAIKNKRRYMEDRHICIEDFNETYSIPNASKASFYAVFDGHDGYHAAYYSAAQLPYLLASSPLYPLNPAEAMRQSFRGTDLAFVQKTYQQSIRGGTTAVCALYLPNESRLLVGWVGDSKALLVKQGKIMQIVKPHKPEDPNEKERIHKAGGTVMNWAGMWRVDGVLNLSRAIGDSKCKPYVTGDPDIVGLELDQNEDFLVLACDGLWDYVAEDKVAEIIYEQLNEDSENLNKIPQKLIERSKQDGSLDNITIVIVFLKDPYKIVKNTCTIEIMEPAFDNCNIGEFNNSEQVLSTNANTTQIGFNDADQSKEFFDDHQHQKQQNNQNSNQLIQQFNDGLNNFLQDPNNICTNMMTNNINNHQFDMKNNFEHNDDDDHERQQQQQFDDKFLLDDFTKNTITTTTTAINDDNINIIDELTKGETPTDFENDACIDVTDDIAMVTQENSEHSTISHSKDTLPLSDNFNPFDNKFEMKNDEYNNPGDNINYINDNDGNDDTKSTPMISPDSEEIMNQGSDNLNDLISPEYEQPIVEELASGGVELLKQTIIDNAEQHQQKNFVDSDFIQTNGHMSPEKQHIMYNDEDIFDEQHQQQIIDEIHIDNLKDKHNQDEEHQNEIFGLNSIKENHFESNYVDDIMDPNQINQQVTDEDEQHHKNDIPIDINILSSNNCDEIIEQTAEECNMHLEEHFNKNFSTDNDFNTNIISDNREQLIEPKLEQQIEFDNIEHQIDHHDTEQNFLNEIEQQIQHNIEQQIEHEIEQIIESSDKQQEIGHDESEQQLNELECEQHIQADIENINDLKGVVETRDINLNEYSKNNNIEENIQYDSEMKNTENYYPIPAESFQEHKMEFDEQQQSQQEHPEEHQQHEQPEEHQQQEQPEEYHQQQQHNFEDDGFVEQEFAEHDNFDEQHLDQSAVPQNQSVGLETEIKPITTELLSSSQQQERTLESCDESEDEWKYMRLKEGEGEKENKKIDNREQEIVDLTTNLLVEEGEIIQSGVDKSIEKNLSSEISLEDPKDLIHQQKQQEILSSSPKPIACNLNKTPIATDLDDDMNYQLNPEAKEFVPLSPPTGGHTFLEGDNNGLILNGDGLLKMPPQKQHLVGDDVVSQSPRKGAVINMDEIYVPDATEFDNEVRNRPHEIIEAEEKLADSTTRAAQGIIDNGSNGDVVQQELYQELNLKEAMHGSEKDEHILSPTDVDVGGDTTVIVNPIFNPVAEFENIDMKDSIYIEKSSSNNQQEQQQQENDLFDNNEDILNHVQLLPDNFESNKSLSSEYVRKEDLSNENEKDIASPINETPVNLIPSLNGLSSQDQNDNKKIENIINDLNILKLSSDDISINESPNKKSLDIELNTAEAAAVAVAATTVAAAGVAAAAISPASDDKKIKAKVAEKNLKNKMNVVKSPKVPEKKLSTTTASTTKTSTTTASAQPKKVASTTSKTSVTSSNNNKPKTLTVATAPAPKTLTFPRPRTAPANVTSTVKTGTNAVGSTITQTTKSRIDATRPATLTVKKPLTTKTTTSTIDSKTNTIKSNISKTGISAKSSTTSRTSATTNTISKPRPSSATTNGTAGNVPPKTTTNLLRPGSVKATTRPPLSPRGTYTSTLRKTEAIKSPTKSTTTTSTITSTAGRTGAGPTAAKTTSRTTVPAKTSGTIRKTTTTTLTAGKSSTAAPTNAGTKKITPIKRPVPIQKDDDKLTTTTTTTKTVDIINGGTSSNETVEQQETKLNGVSQVVDFTAV